MALVELSTIERIAPEELNALLCNASSTTAIDGASRLLNEARSVGLGMQDYLDFKINVRASANPGEYVSGNETLSGFEAALAALNLPIRNDLKNGVSLRAAASTFQTFPGTRIMFPQVVDETARFKTRETNFEMLSSIIGSSRGIDGAEMISVVVDDKEADYQKAPRAIAERGRIPIHKIVSSEQAVRIHKFGQGWELSYEFARRAAIDLLVPYASRSANYVEKSKVAMATELLINGDGVQAAAPVVTQSSFNGVVGSVATPGSVAYRNLLAWLVSRAKTGNPIDTVVGNFDSYVQWLLMFGVPTPGDGEPAAETLARTGFQMGGVPILQGVVNFALSSQAPAGKLIGFSRADTIEELTENGSLIEENERSIRTQVVTYVKSENSGFRLVFGDTRSIYNFAA